LTAGAFDAHAQQPPPKPVDDASRTVARELTYSGIEAYDAGDAKTAIAKLERAYTILQVPSVALWLARALVMDGQLVQASERYLEATRLPILGEQAVQEQAQQEAARERLDLLPRVPRLNVLIRGASPESVEVKLDGTAVPPALRTLPIPMNPGEHVVTWQAGERVVEERFRLSEGQTQLVVISLKNNNGQVQPAEPAHATPSAPPPPPKYRTPALIALGVGGAGLVFGGVTGGLALTKNSELKDICEDKRCAPSASDTVDSYNLYRNMAVIGLAVGAAGAAAGATLLFLDSRERQVGMVFGPGYVGATGRF
jgi:hypothetical protein